MMATSPDVEYVNSMLRDTVITEDPTLGACDVNVVLYDCVTSHSNILGQNRSIDLCLSCRDAYIDSITNGNQFVPFKWCWPRSSFSYKNYAVDWLKVPQGHATIMSGPDFQARFHPGHTICSEACKSLMISRKRYKQMLKIETSQSNANQNTIQSLDKLQYACKIVANSLYGVMSFSQYNTYSPRCGSSDVSSDSVHCNALTQ